MAQTHSLDLSIIVPFLNEEENLPDLYARLNAVLPTLGLTYEIIFIDDGSSDSGSQIIKDLIDMDKHVRLIRFTRNYGQTAAMSAGFKEGSGKYFITLDADNQNDPNDIPKLLDKTREGFNVVSGWRKDRKDDFISRTLPSRFANWLISKVTGVKLMDYGCTLKIYEAQYVNAFNLYGEMHRFIPAYAKMAGAKITEVPVNHLPRTKGESKYGISRTFKVILDLLTVKFLGSFATKPLYLFGGLGMVLNVLAVFIGFFVLYEKFFLDIYAHKNPLLLLAVLFAVLGVMMVMMGLIAELLVRIYHESQGKPIYLVKEKINL